MAFVPYLLIALGAIASLWLLLIIISYIVYIPMFARLITDTASAPHAPPPEMGSTGKTGQDVRFVTRYRQWIYATLWEPFQDIPARGSVILCHSYRQSRGHMSGLAEHLTAAGWNVLALDFCGHGESASPDGYRSVGLVSQYELWDIEAALRFLRKRNPPNRHVWLLGMSKGANAALCAAATWDEIGLVVADSAFGTLPLIEHYYHRLVQTTSNLAALWSRLPRFWIYAYLLPAMHVAARKCRCRFLPVMALLPRIRQPVLLIRGERDRLVPRDVTMQVKRALRCPVELLSLPKAKHVGGFATNPDTYMREVLSLADHVFPSPPCTRTPILSQEDPESARMIG